MRPRTSFTLLALLPIVCDMVSPPASAQAVAERAPVDATRSVSSYSEQIAPVLPSVVKVMARRASEPAPIPKEQAEMMRRLFGPMKPGTSLSEATGFVVDGAGGLIVTADFLLDLAPSIAVQLHDGREVAAAIIGRDSLSGLALLRIDAPGLRALRWGDAHAARVGDVAFAVGHAEPVGKIVNSGIVAGRASGTEALEYQDIIVSDIFFTPAFAGGPLLDSQGRVLGIAVGICAKRSYMPVNCSLSGSEAQRVINDLRAFGSVQRASLGIDLDEQSNVAGEILIANVAADSPAARAGLRKGDVFLQADGMTVDFTVSRSALIGQLNTGRPVQIKYMRDAVERTVTVAPDRKL